MRSKFTKLNGNVFVKQMMWIVLVTILTTTQLWAQVYTYSGTVLNENNETLPGASVVIKGTTTGATTDIDGRFSFTGPTPTATLQISFVGTTTQEIEATAGVPVRVILTSSVTSLEEVVVVGYGTQKVTKVSGAISTLRSQDIQLQKPIRAEESLQGRTSGVSVIQNGSPGSKPTVLIRGIPSFTGTDPVVIIDGIPQSLADFNALNFADIASINVLKDAAATAIYGVKGGNGVIVVTTKTGSKNLKPQVVFNTNFGTQENVNKISVLNAMEYAAMVNEGSVASGGNLVFRDISALGLGTDWQDQIFKDAGMSTNNLSVNGGSETVKYFLSAGNTAQGGIVGGSDKSNFNRINATANFDVDITDKIKFLVNTSYVNIKSQGIQENSFNSIIGSALNFDPTVEIYNTVPNTVGTYGYSNLLLTEIFNPLTKLENTYNTSNGNKLYGKGELQFSILKNLKLTSRLGYINWNQEGKNFSPLVFYGPLNAENTMNADGTTVTGKHNSVGEYQNSNFSFTHESFGNYDFTLANDHNFESTLGYSLSRSVASGFDVGRQDVPYNSWQFADISSATGVNTATNTNAQTGSSWQGLTRRNLSYFGRLNYDFRDKYLASFSLRRDGSIAFGPDNKFANFLAGSLGWLVSEEGFFSKDGFINYLKLRTSYGSIGNENVSPQFVQVVTGGPSYGGTANSNGYTFGETFIPGSTINTFRNDMLSWEKQLQFNVGFDMFFWNNNFSLTADYFNKKVDGLLFRDAAPLYAGTSIPVDANIGSTSSSGVDLTLGYNNQITDKFLLNSTLTFTTSKNEVTATNRDGTAVIPGGYFFNGQSQSVTRFEKGYTPGYFYGYKTDGLFQNYDEIANSPLQSGAVPGDIKFVDVNNDGVISELDKTQIGDPFPLFTMGWNLTMQLSSFDFNVFTYASYGNDVYRAYERNANFTNKFRGVLNRWTGEGTTNDARFPRYSFTDANSNIRPSDRYIEDGSFLKIKNLVIGYSLPKSWANKISIDKLRIYGQIRNLLTLTDYSGYDPEIPGGILDTGVDRGNYPQARTFSIGLDLNF